MFYAASFAGVAVSAQQDLFELAVPASCVVVVHHIELSQETELGDTAEEQLRILLRRGVGATTGSGGSTPTPAKLETGFPASTVTAKANNTTKMSAGTITTIHPGTWQIRSERIWMPPPELRIVLSPSERFTVELASTPADAITMNGALYFEQIGG